MNKITKEQFKTDYLRRLAAKSAKPLEETSEWDRYNALGSLCKDYLAQNWIDTTERYSKEGRKQVYYFSMEFLTGRFLLNNLAAQGLLEIAKDVIEEIGFDFDEISDIEKDQGLGNGGLGRLAACFLDSMAALSIPGHGIGIRYNYGLFEQKIINGYQVEFPDRWLENRNVWEVKKPDKAVEVKYGGDIRSEMEDGKLKFYHEHYETVIGVPYDMPVVGYDNETVNTLRLWSAETSSREFDYSKFSRGQYVHAFEQKHSVESISQVLYPNDAMHEGRILRLKQEYFFVSCGVQGIIRSFKKTGKSMENFHEYIAIHVNDTHPAVAIPELMRILIDDEHMSWEQAWDITTKVMSYTNHTIMQEAMERWPIDMFKALLPRIFMIIEEINERFCRDLWEWKYNGNLDSIREIAIIAEGEVRMANLAIVGSHSINGVAHLHTEILKNKELKPFYDLYPHRFNNKTNGITHRRWLVNCNPGLTDLLSNTIGNDFINQPIKLRNVLKYAEDKSFQEKVMQVKLENKKKLAEIIYERNGIKVNPKSIFDIQVKRLHEYKRQILNVLHIMHLYNRLLEDPNLDIPPRTFIFGAKAAPAYYIAKQTIKLINTVADKVNNDPRIKDKLKVVFMENYSVSLAELLIPAADVSEQISTTTKEASGTGNMKFMMNGAVTIATLDGANVEILNEVGEDNIVIFGLTEPEVYEYYEDGSYNSLEIYNSDLRIKRVIDQLTNGFLDVSDEEFRILRDGLLQHNDEYFVLKDFDSYAAAHERINRYYRNRELWAKMSIINIGCSGVFSSDRTIMEYASGIWDTPMRP